MTESMWDLTPLQEALPEDAAELLRQIGITKADFSGLFSVEFADIVQAVLGVFRGALREPMEFLLAGMGVLLIVRAFGSPEKSSTGNFMTTLVLVTVGAPPLYTALNIALAAVKTCGSLMCALVPILAAVVAASGSPVLSVVWQTAVFAAAQTISAAASGFMAPCCGLMAGTGIFTALLPQMHMEKLTGKIRRLCTWIFSSMATLFTAFLSLKGVLAGSADSLSAKGIKLAVSSFVPVIGTQLSEAYASVVGSLSLVRSTAGVFAIVGICAVVLPAGVQLLLWIAALKLLQVLAAFLDNKQAGTLFAGFDSALSVLGACLLFVAALYVLSVGIILKVRSGV